MLRKDLGTFWLALSWLAAIAGAYVSAVLSLDHVLNLVPPCLQGSSCQATLTGPASSVFGVPISLIGLAGYVLIASIATQRLFGSPSALGNLQLAVSTFGTAVSVFLIAYAAIGLKTVCPWCLASLVCMCLSLAGAYGARRVQSPRRARWTGAARWIAAPLLAVGVLCTVGSHWQDSLDPAPFDAAALAKISIIDLVPPTAHRVGSRTPRTTLLVFGDPACPACHQLVVKLSAIATRYPQVACVYRHFPLQQHADAFRMAVLLEKFGRKSDFWTGCMRIAALGDQPKLTDVIRALNLPPDAASSPDPEDEARVAADLGIAERLGLKETPTLIGISGGKPSLWSEQDLYDRFPI